MEMMQPLLRNDGMPCVCGESFSVQVCRSGLIYRNGLAIFRGKATGQQRDRLEFVAKDLLRRLASVRPQFSNFNAVQM